MTATLQELLVTINQNPLFAYYLAALAGIVPMLRIYKRAGFTPHGAWLLLVPFIGYLLAMAGLVFRRWPVLPAYVYKKKEKETEA